MSWSSRRKSLWGYSVVIIVVLAVGIPLFKVFYVAPTCTDGKQNQNETGIDCGGKCPRVCASAFLSPRIQWSRADKIGDGLYNLGAYVVNPNLDGKATQVPYIFRVYDKDARLIAERSGSTFLPARKNTLVFESAVRTDKSIPGIVTFEFTSPVAWEKTSFQNDGIIVSNKEFVSDSGTAALTATLRNTTFEDYPAFFVYAILYDENKNQIGFSRTKVDRLPRNSATNVLFTWPVEKTGVLTTEITPSINIAK